ncbi:hypothetical protein M9458_035384, partial [Cirrhinus mrigala]
MKGMQVLEVSALYWGPDDQGGSSRSLATWLQDPAKDEAKDVGLPSCLDPVQTGETITTI